MIHYAETDHAKVKKMKKFKKMIFKEDAETSESINDEDNVDVTSDEDKVKVDNVCEKERKLKFNDLLQHVRDQDG